MRWKGRNTTAGTRASRTSGRRGDAASASGKRRPRQNLNGASRSGST
ncbi:MAG: hypothetical protein JRN44_03890 [Nitrososphaerota archaeon]|nr:hypothetical protein [Nitrososphaerota archaeon]